MVSNWVRVEHLAKGQARDIGLERGVRRHVGGDDQAAVEGVGLHAPAVELDEGYGADVVDAYEGDDRRVAAVGEEARTGDLDCSGSDGPVEEVVTLHRGCVEAAVEELRDAAGGLEGRADDEVPGDADLGECLPVHADFEAGLPGDVVEELAERP